MIKQEKELEIDNLYESISDSPQSKDDYKDGVYLITGKAYQIVDDYCTLIFLQTNGCCVAKLQHCNLDFVR